MLRRIVSAAVLAGAVSGLLLTAIQQFEIAPLVRMAEVQEEAEIAASNSTNDPPPSGPARQAWSPATSTARLLTAIVSNIVLATGFALILTSAISRKTSVGWRAGLLWGIAGYAVFFVAPSLGLPPELPGARAAPLHDRELWWAGTVVLSAAGLWLVAFSKKSVIRVLGLVLLSLPHAIGAPQPAAHDHSIPAGIAEDFLRATYLANAALWLAIGGLCGLFYNIKR